MKNYRHGDLALIGIKEIPKDLKPSKSNIVLEGKSNIHRVKNGVFYPHNDGEFVIGYLQADNKCVLLHPEHSNKNGEAPINKGFYECRVQIEFTHEGMRQVLD